jgi:hypothetical protein
VCPAEAPRNVALEVEKGDVSKGGDSKEDLDRGTHKT